MTRMDDAELRDLVDAPTDDRSAIGPKSPVHPVYLRTKKELR